MKQLFIMLAVTFISASVYAGSVASIYNGERYQLSGQMLVQDADRPNDFYILPKTYEIMSETTFDEKTGQFINRPLVNHSIVELSGNKYSVYSLRLQLRQPSKRSLINATLLLRRKSGPGARIVGMAPICGLNIDIPNLAPVGGAPDPKATLIKYSIRTTPGQDCTAILTTTDFNMEIRVPLDQEPQMAKDITSEVGIVLPALELSLPYKYKDQVKLKIEARTLFEQLKAGVGMKGTWKAITATAKANMTKAFQYAHFAGKIHMDCQNPDKTACSMFLAQAQEILKEYFLKFVAVGAADEVDKKTLIGDNDKTVDASLFRMDMAIDQVEADRIGEITIDYSNVVYSTIKSHVQLDVSGVSPDVIDPSIRNQIGPRP